MVSGIGPRPLLRNFSIPMVVERPGVGQNMWDNPIFGVSIEILLDAFTGMTDPQ